MSRFQIEYFSTALQRPTVFDMLIPNDLAPWQVSEYSSRPTRTLFLLHGYSGKSGNWIPEGLPEKYNFAVVMPSAENSFYLNGEATGHNFQTSSVRKW